MLGWSPRQFWTSTPHEFYAAVKAYNQAQGGGREEAEAEEFSEFVASLKAGGVKVD